MGEAGDTTAAGADGAGRRHRERDKLTHLFATLAKVLGVVATIVTLVGGAVTVVFQVDPTLEPCIGGGGVRFTSIQVVPGYSFMQYIRDINNGNLPDHLPTLVGSELRYSYSASNLSGRDLNLYLTLLQVNDEGDVESPPLSGGMPQSAIDLSPIAGVPNAPPPVVSPNRCSQDSSGFDFLPLPPRRPSRRYEILLEFYRGAPNVFTDRVGVGHTPIFTW